MLFQLFDGKGRGKSAGVNKESRVETSSSANSRFYYRSRDNDDGYMMNSHDADAEAGDYIFYFKNDNATQNFVVDRIVVGAVQSVLWKVWRATGTATGGTAITPVNTKVGSGATASATVLGVSAISGFSTDGQLASMRTSAANHGVFIPNDSIIIPPGGAIAIEYDTGTTGIAEIMVNGFYDAA